jgi:hypothetical protein
MNQNADAWERKYGKEKHRIRLIQDDTLFK